MSDPFATALSVLLSAAGSVAVTYLPMAGGSYTTRAIRTHRGEESHHSFGATMRDGDSLTIAVSAIPQPVTGDTIVIGAENLYVLAAPLLDDEGMSWIIQAASDPV